MFSLLGNADKRREHVQLDELCETHDTIVLTRVDTGEKWNGRMYVTPPPTVQFCVDIEGPSAPGAVSLVPDVQFKHSHSIIIGEMAQYTNLYTYLTIEKGILCSITSTKGEPLITVSLDRYADKECIVFECAARRC